MTGLLLGALLASGAASAWETDQLTGRDQPLPDLAPAADARLDQAIAAAVAETNRQTRCGGTDDQVHAVLAQAIHDQVGPPERLPGRPWPKWVGYNIYGTWLEEQPGTRDFLDRSDIYGDLRLWQAPILKLAGTCGTVNLAGTLLGTDKVDHFLGMGFSYWERSQLGAFPARAIAWGAGTERSIYGRMTSSAFSYADLEANLDGYRFYAELLGPDSVMQRQEEDGCVAQVRPFHWSGWVDWRYDEVLNPSVYTRAALAGVRRRLADEQAEICASYARWGGADYSAHLARVLASAPEAAAGVGPPRVDVFQLSSLCEQR